MQDAAWCWESDAFNLWGHTTKTTFPSRSLAIVICFSNAVLSIWRPARGFRKMKMMRRRRRRKRVKLGMWADRLQVWWQRFCWKATQFFVHLLFLLPCFPRIQKVCWSCLLRLRERNSPSEFLGNRLHLYAFLCISRKKKTMMPMKKMRTVSCASFFCHGDFSASLCLWTTGNSNIQHLVIWQPIWFGCGFTTMMVHVCMLSDLLTCYLQQDEEEEKKPAEKACVATVPPISCVVYLKYVLAFNHDCLLLLYLFWPSPSMVSWHPPPGGRRQITGPWVSTWWVQELRCYPKQAETDWGFLRRAMLLKAKTMVTRSAPRIEFTSLFQVQNPNSYCWWTKSCTTKDDDYPIVYRILTIPGGGGFLPSTVACGSNPSISWLPALWVGRSWSTNWRETGGRCVTSVFTHCVSQCIWRIVPFCKWVSNHHL